MSGESQALYESDDELVDFDESFFEDESLFFEESLLDDELDESFDDELLELGELSFL